MVGITPIAFSKGFGNHDGGHREGFGSHDGSTKVGSSYSNPDMMLVFAIAVIGGAICIVGAIFLVKRIIDKNRTNKRSESPLEYMYQLKPANQLTGLKLKSSQKRLTRGITPLE